MKNFNFSRFAKLFALSMFVCALALTGCKKPTDANGSENSVKAVPLAENDALIGTWTSSYGEVFTITKTSLSNGGSWGDCYAGDNLCAIKIDEKSGYIYIKYTRSANPDYTYSETAPDVGKWYAIYYSNLTENSVTLSGAFKADGKTSTETLEEAIEEFTIENDYFAGSSECVKQ